MTINVSTKVQIEWWQPYIGNFGSEKPSRLSQILAETIPAEPRTKTLLDIGCGTGVIGVSCLVEKKAATVTFSDILQGWVDLTRANIGLKIDEGAIHPSQAHVTDAMPFDQIPFEIVTQHDMVVFTLPQYPEGFVSAKELARIEADPVRAAYRLAGPDGLKLTRAFARWYGELKAPKPDAIFVLWSIVGKRQIAEALQSDAFQWRVIHRTQIPIKPEFSRVAAEFSESAEERDNRTLQKDGDSWTNDVLTIKLTGR